MKKILLASLLLFSVLCGFSQSQFPKGHKVNWANPFGPLEQYWHADNRFNGGFDINYSSANIDNQVYIFQMNHRFLLSTHDTGFRWFIVGIDSIHNSGAAQGYSWKSVSSMKVDSIMLYCGHENNSGLNDTLIMKMISVNANGYPAGTVYWADTIISNQSISFPGFNSWLFPQIIRFHPNYTFNAPARFAIRLEYYGPKIDTFGVMCGFVNGGFCSAFGTSVSAVRSHFYPNSYYYYTLFSNQYPTATGNNVYIDCDANGAFTPNSNEEYYIQNLNMWPHVTANILQATANAASHNICNGDSTTLSATLQDGNGPYTYLWSPAASLNNAAITNPTAHPSHTTIYTLEATDAHGAKAWDTVLVVVRPVFSISADTTVCVGQQVPLHAAPCVHYLWSPSTSLDNDTLPNPITNTDTSIIYNCQCTGSDGCIGTEPVQVTITQLPVCSFTSTQTSGLQFHFGNTTVGGVTYQWYFGDAQSSTVKSPNHTYTSTGTYIITMMANNACGSDTIYDTLTVNPFLVPSLQAEEVFHVVPNPATTAIRIENYTLGEGDELILTNSVGAVLTRRSNFHGKAQQIDISNLPNGLYFIQLKTAKGTWTQKWEKIN